MRFSSRARCARVAASSAARAARACATAARRCCSDALIPTSALRRASIAVVMSCWRASSCARRPTAGAASTRARRTRWMIRWSWWPIALTYVDCSSRSAKPFACMTTVTMSGCGVW